MSIYRKEPSWQIANSEHHLDPFAVIYNESQWIINVVTPMRNLQYSALKLKQYGSKIRHAIISSITGNSSKNTNTYSVQIEQKTKLKACEEDSDALIITVSTSIENSASDAKTCYSVILLSWGKSSKLEEAHHLPFLLERGEQKIGTLVKSTLQNLFDCEIKQCSFTQGELLMLTFCLIDSDSSRSTDAFTMSFRAPQINDNNKLNFTFEVGDIHIIWNGIKNEVTSTYDAVNMAYESLKKQIFFAMAVDITALELFKVKLPKAEVNNNGNLKMKTPDTVKSVLTVMNGISNFYE